MVANAAFLAGVFVVAIVLELMDQLAFLAPYKHYLLTRYFGVIVCAALVVFLNFFALFYCVSRWVWLKDTGRKLAFIDRQLATQDTVARELSDRLARQP
jgi:hypothetical protein